MDKKLLSNDLRLKSINLRQQNQLKSKNFIQEALSQNNVNKKTANHIKFDSSSDEDDDSYNHEAPLTRGDDILGFNQSNDDSDDELVINAQYEGENGSKLLSMQSKIGTNDSRFKLDTRFIHGQGEEENRPEELEHEEMEVSEDKKRNLSVLNSVLFSQGISNLPKKRILQFHDPSKKRYDPTNVEHKDMVVEGPKKRKKKKEKLETPAPEVDKTRFYEADVGGLRNVFQKKNEDDSNEESKKESNPVFSFLSNFAEEDEENQHELEKETDLPSRAKAPVMTSSDDETSEEEEDDQESESETEDTKKVVKITAIEEHLPTTKSHTTLFMTSPNDVRITSGPKRFCWNKTSDEIRQDWENLQDFLRTDYRRKHRIAKKVEKHQNKREREQLIFGPGHTV